jgi:hypothetical protein
MEYWSIQCVGSLELTIQCVSADAGLQYAQEPEAADSGAGAAPSYK